MAVQGWPRRLTWGDFRPIFQRPAGETEDAQIAPLIDSPSRTTVVKDGDQFRLGSFTLVVRVDAQAEVIEVASFLAGCSAPRATERAVDRHEVDQRASGAQLDQADVVLESLDHAAEHLAIEREHRRDVADAQDQVVNLAHADHGAAAAKRRATA